MNNKYKSTDDSEIILTELMLPSHSNFSGKIHGGFILSLMDKAAFASASKFSGLYCVTASVNKVDFLNPVEVGELLTLKARINYTGNTSMLVGIRVESQNIQTGEIRHCNSSYFSMVAKDELGKSSKVPGLIIRNEKQMRRFLRAIKQLKGRHERDSEFSAKNFKQENYKNALDNYNARMEL